MGARRRQRTRNDPLPPEAPRKRRRCLTAADYRVVVVPMPPDERAAQALLAWLAARLRP